MRRSVLTRRGAGAQLLAAAGLTSIAIFYVLGLLFFDGFALDLGSQTLPTPRYRTFIVTWNVFGTLSAVLLALALSRSGGTGTALRARWAALPDRVFVASSCAVAFALAAAVRYCVLRDGPLTDDEGAYRFAAELLSMGRLWAESPPMKLFFDQNFMVNDGRLYPAYFLGWPALLSLGVLIKAPGLVNPVLHALTVPPLFALVRRLAGRDWAKLGVLIFLSSPLLAVAAATQLSHTSCFLALTLCLLMYVRARRSKPSTLDHAGFAAAFGVAFCIRPHSALAIGLPLIALWAIGIRRLQRAPRAMAAVAFLGPAVVLAVLFLAILWVQNGAAWRTGYDRYCAYIVENDFRFTTFTPEDLASPLVGFDFSPVPAVVRSAAGVLRFGSDLLGWPVALTLLLVGLGAAQNSEAARLARLTGGAFLLLMLFQRDWGIDTFGPVHATELALPALLLLIAGAKNVGQTLRSQSGGPSESVLDYSLFAPSLILALLVTALLGFHPVRLSAVAQIGAHLDKALHAPERAGLDHAVVFAPFPFAPSCGAVPRHFVFFRPTNHPQMGDRVLWANDLGVAENLRLAAELGGRVPYLLRWNANCQVVLSPLRGATRESSAQKPGRDDGR